jgi:long-chain acyl-CoA synthetase
MDRWDAESALALIERYRITHTHMVPTMFHRLLRLPDAVRTNADVSSLRYVLHGAAPCPVETKRAMIDWFGPIIWEYFAATEGSGASISSEDWLRKPGSVGVPPTIDHVRILDDDGHDCAVGQPGRIHLKRVDDMSFEYFGDPAKTAASHRDNYFSVGDIGYLDSDGFLFVTDRDAEIIVSGGVNIYPAEIESVLLAHPVVRDAAVIGIPNPEWGEEVKAVVECDSGDRNVEVEADLAAFCRDRLAAFKRPRSIDLVGELPRQDNGKLYRNRLRDRYR